jgi:nucleotide-binding universal stress UspA family protein
MTMRILLATDGSVSADHARDLVANATWPEGTHIRVVAALDTSPALFGSPWIPAVPPDADRYEDETIATLRAILDRSAAAVAGPGRVVETELLRASPAVAVVEEMKAWAPDLIVVGSRGHGPVETTLLGSTSSAIVDHATAPVLVARGTAVRTVVFAEDGSEAARAAERLLEAWPVFADALIDVVTVVDVAAPWRTGIAPAMFGNAMDVYGDMIASAHETQGRLAAGTAARLRSIGRRTEMELREGDPAAEIVAAAREDGADLVVMGSRGHTGVTRLVLGGVAHAVLTHAPCSVLIVRDHHRATA